MSTIVVGYDGSAAAQAALARGVAQVARGGKLYVVHAWIPPLLLRGSTAYGVYSAWSYERAELELDQLAEHHPELGAVDWEARLLVGSPAQAVAELAEAVDADEIIVGSRGAGVARALLGSVAHGLLHEAACPVTVIPDRALRRGRAEPVEQLVKEAS